MEHILRDLGSKIDVWCTHDLSERLSQLNLLDSNIKVKVNSILESDIWVVEKSVFPVVWSLSDILLIELMNSSSLTS